MATLFERFSSKENLKKAYLFVQNELTHSSLSINPINHPATTAINDLGEHFFTALEQHLRDGNYKPEKGFFVYLPKDNLGLRPVCVLSMVDRIVYQAILNQEILGYKVDGQLSDKVCFANRVNDDEKKECFLSTYFNGWESFCNEQKKSFNKGYSWKMEVDVQQYYEHIPIEKLIEKLKNNFGVKDEKILGILKEQLCTWAEYPVLPKGIPQGPMASAVLANVYLSSLDTYTENELIGKKLVYLRYADDITLLGKTKEDVLKATEKIVRFLREHNLTLNEKTKLVQLENTDTIEAMRLFSEYDEDTEEIPEDDFTRIQNNIPSIIASIKNGERVEKSEIRELKYFLNVNYPNYDTDLITELIHTIPLRPSLTVPIVKYISEARGILDWLNSPNDAHFVDFLLWETYKKEELSEWSKFWIFKLLVSNKDVLGGAIDEELNDEVKKILRSKDNTIFKIICFYYQAIQERKINIEQVKQAMDGSKTDIEKSLYSFFLLNAFQGVRVPTIKSYIERLLDDPSQELNLIGSYLFKNKPSIKINEFEADFSNCIWEKPKKQKKMSIKNGQAKIQNDFYLIRSENLIPVSPDTAPAIFGVNRTGKNKHAIELDFPEVVQWEKVVLKIKEGLHEVEIWYDKQHIKTASYIELGFSSNKKEHKPDRKWNFLLILSVLQNEDITRATTDNIMSMLAKYSGHATGRTNVHQTKRQLSKELRSLFKTGENPFIENRNYYEPRFQILPESLLRTKEVWKQGGRLNENIAHDDTEE